MDKQAIKVYLDAVWALVAEGDRYFASEKPFDKTLSAERKGTILYVTAEVVRQIALLAQPAMPAAAAKLLDLLGIEPVARSFARWGRLDGCNRVYPAGAAGRIPALCRSGGSRRQSRWRRAKQPKRRKAGSALMLVDHHCHLDFRSSDRTGRN